MSTSDTVRSHLRTSLRGLRAGGGVLFPAIAGFACAALVTAGSLGGVLLPSTYARESRSIAAQSVGQDWVNLVLLLTLALVMALAIGGMMVLLLRRVQP